VGKRVRVQEIPGRIDLVISDVVEGFKEGRLSEPYIAPLHLVPKTSPPPSTPSKMSPVEDRSSVKESDCASWEERSSACNTEKGGRSSWDESLLAHAFCWSSSDREFSSTCVSPARTRSVMSKSWERTSRPKVLPSAARVSLHLAVKIVVETALVMKTTLQLCFGVLAQA